MATRSVSRTDNRGVDYSQAVRDHYEGLYRFALQLCRNAADAEDLTQQTYLQLARKQKKIRDASKVKSWLFSTLYRQFVDHYRRRSRFPQVELEEMEADTSSPVAQVSAKLDHERVHLALGELNETLRAPIALFYIEDCSYKEISEMLNIPIGTVMSRIHRAKTQLYHRLQSSLPLACDTAFQAHPSDIPSPFNAQ